MPRAPRQTLHPRALGYLDRRSRDTSAGPGHLRDKSGGANSFVDVGGGAVHIIRDESGAVAKTVVVQLIPKDATRRIDVTPDPGNCPF